MRVLKYPISFEPSQLIQLPEGSVILHVDLSQHHDLMMWAQVFSHTWPVTTRRLHMLGTGQESGEDSLTWRYINTFFDGPYVWHMFEGDVL